MIKKILPNSFKKFIRAEVRSLFKFAEVDEFIKQIQLSRQQQEQAIPKIDLLDENIANLKTLLNREAFIAEMPKGGVCAEIGVNKGEFSEQILNVKQPAKLHLIDAWGDETRYSDSLKLEVEQKFKTKIDLGAVEINIGYSTNVLNEFPDKYFDWVYLDTDHTYITTSSELKILNAKMKDNGIITGHDYMVGNWGGNFRYGVIEAVNEFCVKNRWELIYLTAETSQCRNFAIKRIL